MLRNGEQLLLAVVIPVLVLVGLVARRRRRRSGLRRPGGRRRSRPACSRWRCMSTSFTSLAIATGFERRYGVLKRLGASPLPRSGLLAGKVGALLLVEAMQLADRSRRSALLAGLGADPGAVGLVGAVLMVAARHRGVRLARPAAGRRPARRGDAGRGQPGLPAAAGRRRGGAARLGVRRVRRRRGLAAVRRARRGHAGRVPRRRGRPWPDAGRAARLGGRRHRADRARTFRWE